MNRVEYFEKILKNCEAALKRDPDMIPLQWIITQLKYLIDLDKGLNVDPSGLLKIKIGWIAVREMDGYTDRELIRSLCTVSSEVDKMLQERGLIKS